MAKAGTPKPKKKKLSKAEQSRRFIEAARELGGDESPEGFDQVFRKLEVQKRDDEGDGQ